jgi:hypothetical protein
MEGRSNKSQVRNNPCPFSFLSFLSLVFSRSAFTAFHQSQAEFFALHLLNHRKVESRPRADVSADDLDARQARTQHVAEMAEASQKRFREAEVVRWDGMRSGWDVGATKVVQAKKPDSIRPTRRFVGIPPAQ